MATNLIRVRLWASRVGGANVTLDEEGDGSAHIAVRREGYLVFGREFDGVDLETAATAAVAYLERMGEQVPTDE
jgi:hypothetical protein